MAAAPPRGSQTSPWQHGPRASLPSCNTPGRRPLGRSSADYRASRGNCSPASQAKDADLWDALHQQVAQLCELGVDPVIAKVTSHLQPEEADSDWEAWAIRGNAAVDSLAGRVKKQRHPQQLSTHANLRAELRHLREVREALHGHIVRVGEISIHARTTQPAIENELTAVRKWQCLGLVRSQLSCTRTRSHSLDEQLCNRSMHGFVRQAARGTHPNW